MEEEEEARGRAEEERDREKEEREIMAEGGETHYKTKQNWKEEKE